MEWGPISQRFEVSDRKPKRKNTRVETVEFLIRQNLITVFSERNAEKRYPPPPVSCMKGRRSERPFARSNFTENPTVQTEPLTNPTKVAKELERPSLSRGGQSC